MRRHYAHDERIETKYLATFKLIPPRQRSAGSRKSHQPQSSEMMQMNNSMPQFGSSRRPEYANFLEDDIVQQMKQIHKSSGAATVATSQATCIPTPSNLTKTSSTTPMLMTSVPKMTKNSQSLLDDSDSEDEEIQDKGMDKSLNDPFGLDDDDDDDEEKDFRMASEMSFSAQDLIRNNDSHTELIGVAEKEEATTVLSRHQSMPSVGYHHHNRSSTLATAGPRSLLYNNQYESMPTLRNNSGFHDTARSLEDITEASDEDAFRHKTSLKATRSTNKDLASEMQQVAAQFLRRGRSARFMASSSGSLLGGDNDDADQDDSHLAPSSSSSPPPIMTSLGRSKSMGIVPSAPQLERSSTSQTNRSTTPTMRWYRNQNSTKKHHHHAHAQDYYGASKTTVLGRSKTMSHASTTGKHTPHHHSHPQGNALFVTGSRIKRILPRSITTPGTGKPTIMVGVSSKEHSIIPGPPQPLARHTSAPVGRLGRKGGAAA
jgi:hypothetical protein